MTPTHVRVVVIDGEPWFVLADLCRVLGLTRSASAVAERLEDGVRQPYPIADSMGREQTATVVSEAGMYEVVIRSDKPEAVKFRRWITGTVLPGKARRHNRFAVALLMVASVLIGAIFYAASAKADTADDWASVYGSAVCDTLDSYPTVSGLAGVLIGAQRAGGLTDEQAGEAVAISVMTRCPEYRPLLTEFVRRYGPVVA